MIGGKIIGSLKDNKQTKFIRFEEFHFDTGMPDEPAVALVNGEFADDITNFYWCGTEKYTVNEGQYEMDINLVEIDNRAYLQLTIEQ